MNKWLAILLILSFTARVWRINYPNSMVFDEVYYVYTAQQYLRGNADSWIYSSKPPKDKTYAWVNPPLPQEIMAAFIKVGKNLWIARLPGVLLGTLSIYFLYLLGEVLFKKKRLGMIAAYLFSLDGLTFVLARTAMLDIYLVCFILISLIFLLKKKYFFSAIFLGLAISSKWSALLILIVFLAIIPRKKLIYFLVSPLVYLLCYIPFFLTGHSLNQFITMVGYQINYHLSLRATHPYSSSWWTWPLNLSPIFFYFNQQGNKISDIFATGNSILYLVGSASIIVSIRDIIKKKSLPLLVLLSCFVVFWLPWITSPRVTFFYYFAPTIPFLCLCLAYQLDKTWSSDSLFAKAILSLVLVNFVVLYPILTGLFLPNAWF